MPVSGGCSMTDHPPLTLNQAAEALSFVSADVDRATWVNFANALFTEFGDAGRAIWEEWSQEGASYNASSAASTWRSLAAGKISIGYLITCARNAGWRPDNRPLSAEERRRIKAEHKERRRKVVEAIERDNARKTRMEEVVAGACRKVLERHLDVEGPSGYLQRKRVGAHGVYFPKRAVLISIDSERERADVWAGTEVREWFHDCPKPWPDHLHVFKMNPGDVVIPVRDVEDTLWSFQVIRPTDSSDNKKFPKFGRKSGCFHVLGDDPHPEYIGITEGYATAASVHEAMGWPVVFAMDAGNLARVLPLVMLRYPGAKPVILGDDDADKPGNPGRKAAEELARKAGCLAVFPRLEVA